MHLFLYAQNTSHAITEQWLSAEPETQKKVSDILFKKDGGKEHVTHSTANYLHPVRIGAFSDSFVCLWDPFLPTGFFIQPYYEGRYLVLLKCSYAMFGCYL